MKKMILSAVIIQLFAGCITVKDTNWEENRQVTSFAGPGSKDSKLVKWKKCERDSGKRVSVGFFPGGAEFLNGSNAGFGAYFLFTSFGNVFSLGAPTLYSLFGGGFSDDSQTREYASIGIIGAYEWKDMKVAKTNVVKFANCEEVVERHSIYTPEKNIPLYGKTGDLTPLFFDYPGFNALFEKVKECGAVAVMHDEGSYSYRLFRRSKYVDGTMVYKDVDLGRDKIADEQINHQRAVRKMCTAMNALRKHRGFPFADKNLKKDFSDLLIKIDNEFKLSLGSSSSALKYLENRMMELKKGFEKAHQDEVARVRKLEVERIAENVKKIEKLIEVENFNEVLKICEGELHQTKPGANQEDVRIWKKYKDKVKKCQVAKKVKKIEGLLKSGSFNEVLKICEGELHSIKPGANQEDVRIWEKYKERAQKGQKDKNRADELARLAELKKKLEQLTREEKWDEIITLCTTEQQNLSRECCLPEDKLIWDGFITKAIAERRVVEIARFEGMKSEVELLFNNSEWTKVVALCDEELERSSRVISDENRYFWSEYRKKAEKEIKKIQLEREIKTLEAEKASLTVKSLEVGGDLESEEKLGEELVDWIMQRGGQTSYQEKKSLKNLKVVVLLYEELLMMSEMLRSICGG